MKYTELEKKLRKAGCYQVGNGDHPIWYSPITKQRFATGHHDTHEVNPKTHFVMKKVKVFIEKGKDDYSAYMDNTPLNYSCIGQGSTVEEAIEDFKACYNEMRQTFEDAGEPFEEVEAVFCYDIPSFLQEFAFAFSLAGLERITGVNQKQLGHYISGYRKPSERTIRKIEDGIHRFSEQLNAVRFA